MVTLLWETIICILKRWNWVQHSRWHFMDNYPKLLTPMLVPRLKLQCQAWIDYKIVVFPCRVSGLVQENIDVQIFLYYPCNIRCSPECSFPCREEFILTYRIMFVPELAMLLLVTVPTIRSNCLWHRCDSATKGTLLLHYTNVTHLWLNLHLIHLTKW